MQKENGVGGGISVGITIRVICPAIAATGTEQEAGSVFEFGQAVENATEFEPDIGGDPGIGAARFGLEIAPGTTASWCRKRNWSQL